MSSPKFLSIPTTLTLTINLSSSLNPPRTPSFFPNPTLTLRLHLTQNPKNPFFHTPSKTHLHLHHPLLAAPPSSPAPPPDHQSEQVLAAQEAILEFLQELGVSEEEAIFVSSNSPRYMRVLVDGVQELDELGVWREQLVGFKEKVKYLAKEKGDNGKVAFLESVVGLGLSSAMNIARHSSAETLPGLIDKVKYVKEIFFSGSNDGGLIGKNARRMMMHLSIPIDEDLQLTLSFFEKIAARRGGLDMLGSEDATFRYLIESFPRLLLLSLERHMTPVVEYLENMGVRRESMRTIFLLFPPVIFCNIKVITARVRAFKEFGLEDKDVGRMLIKYPWILSTSIHENFKEVLSFFDLEKVPKANVGCAIRSWPHILGCSTSTLKVMVEQIDELGIANKKLGQVISRSPQLLLRKPKEFLQVVSFMEGLGFDKETVGTILGRCPEIFAASIERTLKRKLDFLASIGVSKVHLPRVIKKYPELLVSDTDRTLLPRVKYLMKKGLSQRDIAFMVRRFSPLLGYSIEEVLRPKLEFLLNTMEKPITEVVDYPRYFSYSLEKKIKPRYLVLKGKNITCSLKDMLAKNDEEFALEFMSGENMLVTSPSLTQQ
ncbi:putative transcription regulator mTERF family [Rosa chinensis]|uniref:Putative transcription regulator mTERF family n=1 Tax=Rosa chinensis TaxID=74649 RepID=A0A2P6RZK2_ROSCH|nr:transcription termination factor MTERF2, chloroplastic [Rosa chinensis]PRQ51849.1 putative transcription regulator mTERF family [Rosa chinensis]